MKIFVTGATGFIGKRLLPKFSQFDEVYILCRRDPGEVPEFVQPLIGDLDFPHGVFSRLAEIRPDACIHLAWGGIPDYGFDQSFRNLQQGTQLIHHLAEKCGCKKIIVPGSCWEYGKSFGACREDECCQGGNYFIWAKRALLDFGLILAARCQFSFVWPRLFYVYGPGQRPGSLIPTITDAVIKGRQPDIQTPFNANDFVYVDDVAAALLQMVKSDIKTGIYNIGSGITVPVWKVCEVVERSLGWEPINAVKFKSMKGSAVADFCADTTKTESSLDWRANISLEKGIELYLRSLEVQQ